MPLPWSTNGQKMSLISEKVRILGRPIALARTGPRVPVVPRTNPVLDQTWNVIWDI